MQRCLRACVLLTFALPVLSQPAALCAGDVEDQYVRMDAKAFAEATRLGLGAESVLDYGSFVWARLDPTQFAYLHTLDLAYQAQPDTFVLRLGEQTFDPLVKEPDVPLGWEEAQTDGPDLHLVQFIGPTRADWLDNVREQGLAVVQYVHPFTYIVWGSTASRTAATETENVRWAGSFLPAYRVLPRYRTTSDTPIPHDALLCREADTDAVVQALRDLGIQVGKRHVLNGTFEEVGLTLSGNVLMAVARIPGVYSIQAVPTDGGLRGEMSDQVNVNNVDATNLAFPGYLTWLSGIGLDGSGAIIANVDAGIDHTHPDLVNRMLSCSGTTCGGSASDSHGTHTAGIMAADGSTGATDSYGFLRGLGQAPGANLVEQVYSPFFTQPGGMLLLMTDSYNNGASLSGNSWGPAGAPLGYDNDTMQVDIGVRDADPDAPGNQPLTYVLSIMNGYGGTSSQGTPDEAKNIFTIGSTKMQTSSGAQILDINDLSSNSAHGPCLDGRNIPHLVAPGCNVDSTVPGGGHGVSGWCGTSMASPHVSGAVAVFIEYYRGLPDYLADPSPALIKAAFLPVAHDLAGYEDADGSTLGHPFDSKQGWGRLDLEAVVDPQVPVRYFDNPTIFDNTGQEWTMDVSPLIADEPMRLMLVWTDAPGHGLGGSTPAWNNDLDLVVEVGGDTYRGNQFGANGWSIPGGSADGMHNTEGVLLGPTAPAAAHIRVIASDVNSDGIPNQGDSADQDFALVCYNCAQEPGFVLSAAPGTLGVCAPTDAVYTVDVVQILDFTEAVTLTTSGEPAGTTVDFDINPVVPPGATNMTISNTGSASPGSYTIAITGTAPSLIRETSVGLDLYNGVPGTPSLIAPPNGAIDVSRRPEFEWTEATQAGEYKIEVATDSGFSNIVDMAVRLTDTTYQSSTLLDAAQTYYWRVLARNLCGMGSYSETYSFTTQATLSLLLVDDDDNSPDVRSTYTDALDALGQEYEVWNTNNSDNEPDAATLTQYATVVWFTGDEYGGFAGPGSAGEAALASFLDGGGCLFISGQDYYYDRGLTSFMSDYLGVATASSDVSQSTVTGAGTVFGGMGPYTLSYPFSNFSDIVSPSASAELAFSGNVGDAAVAKDSGVYRTTFWGFPFEAVGSAADREDLMATVLDWCQPEITDCNNNGVPDDEDIASGTSEDCNTNGIPDECETNDCNENGVPDDCDIADGTSQDCNTNGIPDECESNDCNGNSAPDECDIADGTSQDLNTNGIPDECEIPIISSDPPDGSIDPAIPYDRDNPVTYYGWDSVQLTFDGSTSILTPDDFVVTSTAGMPPSVISVLSEGAQATLFFDRPIPDQAWTTITHHFSGTSVCLGFLPTDADNDSVATPADILTIIDNLNGVLDPPLPLWRCDIDRSTECTSFDILAGIDLLTGAGAFDPWLHVTIGESPCTPGEPIPCEQCANPADVAPAGCRYLAVSPNPGSYPVSLVLSCDGGSTSLYLQTPTGPDNVATLTESLEQAAFLTPDEWGVTVYVGSPYIAPSVDYTVYADFFGPASEYHVLSPGASASPYVWGDTVGNFINDQWTPPNGVVDFNDISAAVDAFMHLPTAPPWWRCDVVPEVPDGVVDFTDIGFVVEAFRAMPYPFDGPENCP